MNETEGGIGFYCGYCEWESNANSCPVHFPEGGRERQGAEGANAFVSPPGNITDRPEKEELEEKLEVAI